MSPEAARRAISAVFFVNGAVLAGWGAHIPDAKHRFGMSEGTLGLVLLSTAIGAVSTMPMAGPLIHRVGSRTLLYWAGLAVCAIMPFLFTAPAIPWLVGMLILVGASNGQMDVAMNTHSMAVQDRFSRPIISAIHGWFSIGGFVGGMVTAQATRFGIGYTQHLASASLVLTAVLVVSHRHLLPKEVDQNTEDEVKLAFPKGRLWLIGGLMMAAFVGEGALWDWSGVYIRDGLHAEPWLAPLGFGVASFGMAVGRFLGDGWTHRLGLKPLFIVSALLTGVSQLMVVLMPSPELAILFLAIAGIGLANIVPILFRAAATVPGVSAGYGLAAVTTCGYSSFLAGPAVVGFIAQHSSLAFALGLVAILCVGMSIPAAKAIGDARAGTESVDQPSG